MPVIGFVVGGRVRPWRRQNGVADADDAGVADVVAAAVAGAASHDCCYQQRNYADRNYWWSGNYRLTFF